MEVQVIFRTAEDIQRFREEKFIPDYFSEEEKQMLLSREWKKWETFIPYRQRGRAKREQRYPMTLEKRV